VKLRWILNNVPGVTRASGGGRAAVREYDTFLTWSLLAGLERRARYRCDQRQPLITARRPNRSVFRFIIACAGVGHIVNVRAASEARQSDSTSRMYRIRQQLAPPPLVSYTRHIVQIQRSFNPLK